MAPTPPRRRRPGPPALLLALLLSPFQPAAAGGTEPEPAELRLDRVPARPTDAPAGSEFARLTSGLPGRQRQARAVAQLVGGNLPGFLRSLVPVRLAWTPPGGGDPVGATIWVTPDYLAVGSDDDYLRIPLTYPSAVTVASRFGCVLPTRKMVDAIYEQAAHRLPPIPMRPGPRMRSSEYYLEHQRRIEAQRSGLPAGELTAGHKKDVVITGRLRRTRGRIAIYGWHRGAGSPIQPLSTVHGARYADYSHGVRLVHAVAWIDGRPRSILEALADPELGPVLSYEGIIVNARELMDPRQVAAASP